MKDPGYHLPVAPVHPVLQAYTLGLVDYREALALQRRLVYEVSGGHTPALLLCEHPPILTIGREGSQAQVHIEDRELQLHGWPKLRVNRGGGCWLQTPGQLAIYPILPLEKVHGGICGLLAALQRAIVMTLRDFTIEACVQPDSPDVWAGERPIACLGVAVRDWVSYHGAVLNVDPDLAPFRHVLARKDYPPMTSLERERRGRVRPALVRQLLLENLTAALGFHQAVLFTEHPRLDRKATAHATLAAH